MKIKGFYSEILNVNSTHCVYIPCPYFSSSRILIEILVNNKIVNICDKDLKQKINNYGN